MKFALVALTTKYPVAEVLERVVHWCSKNGHQVNGTSEIAKILSEPNQNKITISKNWDDAIFNCDVVISVGGDGTMLRAAKLVVGKNKPILGINSGRLGFLANIPQDTIEHALEDTAAGNYAVDKRFMLEATTSDNIKHYALNEFLFAKSGGGMVTVSAFLERNLINRYWCDGIIVASPTGSTAYNLSSGGPIIMPTTNVMVLNPINPHTLTTRPLVLPADKILTILPESPKSDVLFSKDGENCEITGDSLEVKIHRTDFTIDLIKLPEQTYFDTLRNKLMWGRDVREI